MNLFIVDFKAKRLLSTQEVNQEDSLESSQADIFESYRQTLENQLARFSDQVPKQGLIFKQDFKNGFDSYGYGNSHDSFHQWKGGKYWNSPIPVMADLFAINAFLEKNQNKTIRFGKKSDPFMWMDSKYEMTKKVFILANKYNVKLVIHTMSDLCAREDYRNLIKAGNHSVVMNLGLVEYQNDRVERILSPGAPSLKRRNLALSVLRKNGVSVKTLKVSVGSLSEKKRLILNKKLLGQFPVAI